MSSDLPSDAPSPRPERPPGPELGLAALLRVRGGPLVEALERHLPGSREHAEATASYAFATAVELGFERARCEVAREIAKLHEIGLVYVPVETISKRDNERDEAETAAYEGRFEAGYRLARGAALPEHAAGWLLRQRERFDGSGPEGLDGERIPIESRMIHATCLCQTALAGPGSTALPPHQFAVEVLTARAGGELDPRVVAALTTVVNRASGG